MKLPTPFAKAASVLVLAGGLSVTEANALQPAEVEGSLQSDGGVCFQMPKIRIDGQGTVQPNGTTRICTHADGSVKTPVDPEAFFQQNVYCVVAPDPHNINRKVDVPCPTF